MSRWNPRECIDSANRW